MKEISRQDIVGQLLDVTVSIGCYELTDEGQPYVTSRIIRLDVEGDKVDQFIRDLVEHDSVVEHQQLGSKKIR